MVIGCGSLRVETLDCGDHVLVPRRQFFSILSSHVCLCSHAQRHTVRYWGKGEGEGGSESCAFLGLSRRLSLGLSSQGTWWLLHGDATRSEGSEITSTGKVWVPRSTDLGVLLKRWWMTWSGLHLQQSQQPHRWYRW